MGRVEPIDLHHMAVEKVIGVYVLDTADGPALFDCGPSTTIDALKAGLAERGLALTDIRHLLLSHIDVEAWYRTLDEIERRAPERLALIHFGVVEDVPEHLETMRRQLALWTERVGAGVSEGEVV